MTEGKTARSLSARAVFVSDVKAVTKTDGLGHAFRDRRERCHTIVPSAL